MAPIKTRVAARGLQQDYVNTEIEKRTTDMYVEHGKKFIDSNCRLIEG